MAIFKCGVCGADMNVPDGSAMAECKYCGNRQSAQKTAGNTACAASGEKVFSKLPGARADFLSDIQDLPYASGADGAYAAVGNTASLLKRAFMFLEDGEWYRADEYFEKVLDINPECAEAYLGKLMVECRVGKKEDLCGYSMTLERFPNYQKALRFADEHLKGELLSIRERGEAARCESIYQRAVALKAAFTVPSVQQAMELFGIIPGWKDADEQLRGCESTIREIREKREAKRIAQEQARIAQEQARKKARQAARKKARKRFAIISLIFVASVAFLALVGYFAVYPLVCSKNGNYSVYINIYKVKEFEVPDSAKSIEDYAFCDCESLTSVTVPDSVKSIGNYAFSGCTSLTTVTLGDGVTSIGENAFRGCASLTSITIPDKVSGIGKETFYDCSKLASVTVPYSVKTVGDRAFYNCVSLSSISIPGGVTSIGEYAFYKCSALESISIPYGVTSIGEETFTDCSKLSTVIFEGDSQLASIEKWAFYGCSSLNSITIPDTVISIGEEAFCGCSSLTSITVPNSVNKLGERAFSGCSSLASITLPFVGVNFESQKSTAFKSVFGKVPGSLKTVVITGGTSIAAGAFEECGSLTSIVLPDGVTSIGAGAFQNCDKLQSITIPSGVTSIGIYAFRGCSSLTSITIPNSVTSIDAYAFCDCTSLTSIKIPSSVKSIGTSAFAGCTSLTSATFVKTNGWICNTYGTSTVTLQSVDLASAFTAARYLSKVFAAYTWSCN